MFMNLIFGLAHVNGGDVAQIQTLQYSIHLRINYVLHGNEGDTRIYCPS